MSRLSVLNAIIVLPLLPLVFIVATWWFPWESRIPWKRAPKAVLGPYLMYASFVAYHFEIRGWAILAVGAVGLVVTLMGLLEFISRKSVSR
jgi:hypothetical protein